jgi:replicative DNA helicase
MEKRLYDSNSTMYVLGALIRDPSLVEKSSYILTESDFIGLHKILFGAIYNLRAESIQKITPLDIDLYLKQYSKQYDVYKKENGLEYLQNIYGIVDATFEEAQFEYYYNRVKKFTILRDLDSNGIDIKPFYNPDVDFTQIDKENERLNSTDISDIFNKVREKLSIIEDKNISKSRVKAINAAHNIRELIDELRANPEVGYPLSGDILNFAARGAREGKLYLFSAPTGHGKTRFLVGNACSLSLPYIEDGKIVKRDNLIPVLFIATEMDPDEIQTLVLSYVSGVNEEKILTNRLNHEEERLIEVALKIIEQYENNFKIEKISDPSISSLRSKLTRYVLAEGFQHIFYDYIFTSPSLNLEFSKTGLREDVVLMMLSNTLKEIASDYGVFVYTGTQVSRGWEKAHFRNENFLAGSKAIADKIDFGVIAIKLTEEDKEKIEPLLLADGINELPNLVLDIYKNRRGRIVNAKIFRIFDYGTCRTKDLIMTDTNYNKWNLGVGRIDYNFQMQDLLDLSSTNSGGEEDE